LAEAYEIPHDVPYEELLAVCEKKILGHPPMGPSSFSFLNIEPVQRKIVGVKNYEGE
jgi:hypothetical protein